MTVTEIPVAHVGLRKAITPEHWVWSDVLDQQPARLAPWVGFCSAYGGRVQCHAPTACDQMCAAYNARRVG